MTPDRLTHLVPANSVAMSDGNMITNLFPQSLIRRVASRILLMTMSVDAEQSRENAAVEMFRASPSGSVKSSVAGSPAGSPPRVCEFST